MFNSVRTHPATYNRAMQTFDIAVHGSGAVGLAAALALARLGLRVALHADGFESTRSDVRLHHPEDLRAYALNERSVSLLQSFKVWDALAGAAKTPVLDMRIEGDASGAALHFSAWQQRVAQLAWIVDAAALEAALRDAVRFAPHITPLARNEPSSAVLQVFADGKDSAARTALGVAMVQHRYGQRAVAARLVADQPHLGLARQWFKSPDVLALLPFDMTRPGHGYGLVWSLPDERAAALMAAPVAEFEAALMSATGGAAGALQLASARADWPLSCGRAAQVCGAGWLLVGDAAHVVHPLAGQGLNMGLADVAELTKVIQEREPWRGLGDEKLLRRYARQREWSTQAMVGLTDGLLQLFAHDSTTVRSLRNQGLSWVNRLGSLKRTLAERAFNS